MEFRLPKIEDKEQVNDYIQEHYANNESEIHASNMLTSFEYEDWIAKINRNAETPDSQWGRSLTYIVIDDCKIIGMLNIRYELSPEMQMKFGNIGYGVRPTERKKGYATKILQFALKKCRDLGMGKAILGCYKDNIGSAKTILKNGGTLISESLADDKVCQYYEIQLQKNLEER